MNKIVVLTPDRDQYFEPIRQYLNYAMVFVRNYRLDDVLSHSPAVVLMVADWIYPLEKIAIALKQKNIPTVLFMDGTIEWKHLFENPKWSYGGNPSPFFPVSCDKIFVPGYSTLRFLEFFGNAGKCEIIGQPRFDFYSQLLKEKPKNKARILGVMSGNIAGYTDAQIMETSSLFEDLYEYCHFNGIEVIWRLRKDFSERIKFKIVNDSSASLIKFLEKVDAVICQPSTAAYEAMIVGLPVALADYNIAPNYMTASWFIHSKDQIKKVLDELLDPPEKKIILQDQILEDTVSFVGSSSFITGQIINELARDYISGNYNNLDPPKYLFLKYLPVSTNTELGGSFFSRKIKVTGSFAKDELIIKQMHYILKLEENVKRKSFGYWLEKAFENIAKRRK